MDPLDLYYRAFLEYKKTIGDDKATNSLLRLASSFHKIQHENLILVYYECTIEEDWIIALETALQFLEKAIKEDRQFIRNDEDVLPIEKIRKTSRQSIQDLSKHSDYITRKPDPNNPSNVTPDKLMIVRKENDYSVYENRVLYTTILYAKEFVESRLNVIKDAVTKYQSTTYLEKTLDTGSRMLALSLKLNEVRKEDPNSIKLSKVGTLLTRIEDIFTQLLTFLKTPLLVKFDHTDLVKRPITKTNVLKINLNFKNTLALYDYLSDYPNLGYTIKKVEESFLPLSDQTVIDYAHVGLLMSFLSYQYSNRLSDQLSQRYFEEEEKRLKAKEDQLLAELKTIHLKINQSGKTLDAYLLMFEEGYRLLEHRIDLLTSNIKDLQHQHTNAMHELKLSYEKKLNDLHQEHLKQKPIIEQQHQKEILELQAKQQIALQLAEQNLLDKEKENAMLFEQKKQELQSMFDEKNQLMDASHQEDIKLISEHKIAYQKLQSDYDLLKGELIVIKEQQGIKINPDDVSNKDRFEELERISKEYQKLMKQYWQVTKKAIRKEIFSQPKEKPRKDQSNDNK
jgi:hypothetical protein